MKYFSIFAGGGAGALMRYMLSGAVYRYVKPDFPWGTMAVNLLGCFLIGLLYQITTYRIVSPDIRNLVLVGFLGGFTTFSTFSLESINLIKAGQTMSALGNMLFSTVLGIILVVAGMKLTDLLFKQGGM